MHRITPEAEHIGLMLADLFAQHCNRYARQWNGNRFSGLGLVWMYPCHAELLHVWKNANSGSSVAPSIQSGLGTSNNTQPSPQIGRTESRINNSDAAVKVDTSPLNLNIGEIIFHPKFGKGKITAFKDNNGQVQIDFDREGSKWLSFDVAKNLLSLF